MPEQTNRRVDETTDEEILTVVAEREQQITNLQTSITALQGEIEALRDSLGERRSPTPEDLVAALKSQIQQAVSDALSEHHSTLQALQAKVNELNPPSLEAITNAFDGRFNQLKSDFTTQNERVDAQLAQLQNEVQALQLEEIVKKVETIISQIPIPSVAEITAALNGRLDALDELSKQQDDLIQGQANLQQQQKDLAETITQLGETVSTLKPGLLAVTESQFNAFQTQVDQKISEAVAEFIKQIEPVLTAQKGIEAATQQLNTVSTTLTSEFATLKSGLQGEVNALKEGQGEIGQTAENLSSAMGKLDGQVQQIAQAVRSLEGVVKELETFASETLLPQLQGQLESALKELKSAQEAHQRAFETKMNQTLSNLEEKVGQLEKIFWDVPREEKILFPPFNDGKRYEQAMEYLRRFKDETYNPNLLEEAEKRLNSLKTQYSPNLTHCPLFAAEVENQLAYIYYLKTEERKGKNYARRAKEFIEAHYEGLQIREEKELLAQIKLNDKWIDKGSKRASTMQPGTPSHTFEGGK